MTLFEIIRRSTNSRGYWLTPDIVDDIIAAVEAHLASDAVVERAYRAFALEICRQDGQPHIDLDKQLRETAPSDLRKVEATMRAALAAAGEG